MRISSYPLTQTPLLRPLISDYLLSAHSVSPLYDFEPNMDGLSKALAMRKTKWNTNREVLQSVLRRQYSEAGLGHEAVNKNIDLLGLANCYTVTTGHQLNLFGGTQYFIYKIVETINLARAAREKNPDSCVVPVFWMASEDHDFEEINHVWIQGTKHGWHSGEKGAVGRFNPAQALDVVNQLEGFWKLEPVTGSYLRQLFAQAYGMPTLSQATRHWVHALFGHEGLVILDGDDRQLKQLFVPHMRKELHEELVFRETVPAQHLLELNGYHLQVQARPINLFYLHNGGRERLTKHENGYGSADSNLWLDHSDMETILDEKPECLSPNALMRPLYQEVVLPNLAYVGGTAEIAYWLEMKEAFRAMDVFFPVLVTRSSAVWIPKRLSRKMVKLPLKWADYLGRKEDVIAKYAENHPKGQAFFALCDELCAAYERMSALSSTAFHEMKLLSGTVAAEKRKEIKKLRHDLRKTIKAKHDAEMLLVHQAFDLYYPQGIFQERRDTFLGTYMAMGQAYFQTLLAELQPMGHQVLVLEY
ncbi:MAG: bacillithiol biosynthesis cysteine-adding enzyme BshC [Bacteroidetes bacterium]|nr:bacillithiol biosynthesis cysteine-adding enzyme BshC [Bacteroidota bacterium]